jgi:AraC family transcriptional regulator
MTTKTSQHGHLGAGEHYGSVFQKLRIPSAIVSESVYEKKMPLPEHSHELAFFTLILNGRYSEEFGGKEFSYSPMTVVWRQADTSHKDSIDSNSSRFFFVEIERACLEKLLPTGNVPDHLWERSGSLSWLAHRLRNEMAYGENFSPLIAEGITLEMIGSLTRKKTAGDKKPPAWLLRIVEKLNVEFSENFSSEELAAEAGVHPVHLAAAFRRFYHRTIGEYVQNLRIAHASKLLLKKEISLAEIAVSGGFADQSHFTRVFKRLTGITPGAFRNSHLRSR